MTDKQDMLDYMAKVKEAMKDLATLGEVIGREVTRRFGRRIDHAPSVQERKNLRLLYTNQVASENLWHRKAKADRDLYISLATMHGIAALVELTHDDTSRGDHV